MLHLSQVPGGDAGDITRTAHYKWLQKRHCTPAPNMNRDHMEHTPHGPCDLCSELLVLITTHQTNNVRVDLHRNYNCLMPAEPAGHRFAEIGSTRFVGHLQHLSIRHRHPTRGYQGVRPLHYCARKWVTAMKETGPNFVWGPAYATASVCAVVQSWTSFHSSHEPVRTWHVDTQLLPALLRHDCHLETE